MDQEVCEVEEEGPARASRGESSVVHLRRIVRGREEEEVVDRWRR